MDAIMSVLDVVLNPLFTIIDGFVDMLVEMYKGQENIIKLAIVGAGASIAIAGTFTIIKKLSKLIIIAFIVLLMYILYTEYLQ